jgi:hypothetical protein
MAAGILWSTASIAAKPKQALLPQFAGVEAACDPEFTPPEHRDGHTLIFSSLGTFTETDVGPTSPIMVETGTPFISKGGLKSVPLRVVSIGGRGFAEGIGETRFWLDATRPVDGAIWEKRPGTEFPAIQEMRFHFFYTLEAMPGRVFRSVNPAVMRSEDVRAFPPLPGTVYKLARPVELEDISEPGVVVGRVVTNRVEIAGRESKPHREQDAREQ